MRVHYDTTRSGTGRAHYVGHKFYEGKDGYWQVNKRIGPGNGERLLHRVVWTRHHGPIPDGYDVHHIDENRSHNDIENLEMVEHGKHMRHHKARPRVPMSDSQREWRRDWWSKRPARKLFCLWCWEPFYSNGMRAKYCGVQHRDAYKYANRAGV